MASVAEAARIWILCSGWTRAGRRDIDQLVGVPGVPANPGHSHSTLIDENLADVLKEVVARGHADDRLIHAAERGVQAIQTLDLDLVRLVLGDVAQRREDGGLAVIGDRRALDLHVARRSIQPHDPYFDCRGVQPILGQACQSDRMEIPMHQLEDRLTNQHARVVGAEHGNEGRIDVDQDPVPAHPQRLGRQLHQSTVQSLALVHRLVSPFSCCCRCIGRARWRPPTAPPFPLEHFLIRQ